MKQINYLAVLLLTVATGVAANDAEDVTEFFDDEKVGHSADYGVFKGDRYHVISVHGFWDDLEVCLEIAELLNKEQPDTYSCKPLNH